MQINQEDILGWRNHKDYFTVSNKRSPSFKMIKPKIDKIIIQNSWPLIFDPISGNIYEEKYRISISDDNENLIDVLKNIIANANLFENESFFLSCSGYWSIIDSSSYYVGSGENGLLLSSSKVKTGEFGISYCSRDFILIVSGKIINYQITNVLELHLICTNYYLPFADILFPFRKSLKKYDNFVILNHRFGNINEYYLEFERKMNEDTLTPIAISPLAKKSIGRGVYYNDDFEKINFQYLDELKYIVLGMKGGYIEKDFQEKQRFKNCGSLIVIEKFIIVYSTLCTGLLLRNEDRLITKRKSVSSKHLPIYLQD